MEGERESEGKKQGRLDRERERGRYEGEES
jgi:hypothetical protein